MKELIQIADTYAENYVPMYRKVVRQAFLAGMTFDNMVSKKEVTPDMICKDFFTILDEEVIRVINKIKEGKV